MKRFFAVLLFALVLPLAARADDASKQAKIDELFNLMKLDKLMSQMMDAAMQQSTQMVAATTDTHMDAKTQVHFDVYMKKVKVLIESQLGWKSLEPDFVHIYDENFTEAQIDDILTFYKSPTGTALLEKMPVLTQQGMEIAQAKMAKLQPQMKQMVDDFVKEIVADQAAKSSSSKPTAGRKARS